MLEGPGEIVISFDPIERDLLEGDLPLNNNDSAPGEPESVRPKGQEAVEPANQEAPNLQNDDSVVQDEEAN